LEKVKVYPISNKVKDIYHTLHNTEISTLLLEGAVRSGKSHSRNWISLSYIKELPSPASILVSGRTRGTVKQNVLNEWERLFGNIEFKRSNDASGEYYTIPIEGFENKKIYVRGADKQTDFKKIQGMTLDFWYRDERTNHHKSFFDMRLSRLSKEHSKCILTCNPDSPYHYLKTDFIDVQKSDPLKAKYFRSWSFLFEDNPSLTFRYKEKAKSSYSGVFYDRYIKGLWVLAEGLIYDNFKKSIHTQTMSQQFINDLKKVGQVYIGVDYGTLNATVFLKFIKYKEKFYLIDEFCHSGRDSSVQKTTTEYRAEMKKFIGNDNIKGIYIDPSASYFKTDLIKQGIKKIINAKNDVLDGIRMTQDYFTNNNLIINTKCSNTIKELETYSWDEKASLNGEDKPLKVNDHRMDALRYVIFSTPNISGSRNKSY